MRQQGRGEERQTPPFPTRHTKAKKASEQRGRLEEEDSQREGGEEEEVGEREREREREMVSQKVIKKQVEEKGRVVVPHCQRRLMDKRASQSMSGIEVKVEVRVASDSPSGQQVCGSPLGVVSGETASDSAGSLQHTGHGEVEEPLSLLACVALAPLRGDPAACSCEGCVCVEGRRVEGSLQSMQLQLQFLMGKAAKLQDCLANGQDQIQKGVLAAAVPRFLYTCQPYFNQLECAAKSTVSQFGSRAFDLCPWRMQLLDFSQQLCDRLEQLVVTYASYNLLSLDESEPNSVSHFCIGQRQLGRLRLSTFLYCRPTPYLARVDTGLYKRMRWNVDRLRDEQQRTSEEQGGEGEAETVGDTEYYFLCYEDIPNEHAIAGGDITGASHDNVLRMWSIGQWVQMNPHPDTEDISDWILCKVPQARYHRLLFLGSAEPSSCSATDFLQQLLLSRQAKE
ncbi:UPF0575 protein C19orf67-like protein [Nibea albiflora]|uniref:UPF0575 protein C19orf67-like protein n=1 Tax=Nibea albiflora TaxID=240163 RepID=A0ACB7FKC8_NIBAL|nr:UPF0575 protein C19orf67-like protein [Nibea albiflora]